MKKLNLLVFAVCVCSFSFGQFTVNNQPYFDSNVVHSNYSSFDVGGVTLQYTHDADVAWTRGLVGSNIFWNETSNKWSNTRTSTYRDFSMMRFENGSVIGFFVSSVVAPSSTPMQLTNSQMEANRVMTLTQTHNVGIGTKNPDSKLTVKGKIHCEEVKVDLSVPADYVFEKYYNGTSTLKEDYTMPTLKEVEAYTKANHHLPEMPSAKEIQENGLKLKEMTNLLLQKIEELTLYTIEQEKRINALEEKLTSKE